MRSILRCLVPLVQRCEEKHLDAAQIFALAPEAVAALYYPDLFASGSGYSDMEAKVGAVVAAALQNQGADDLGPDPQTTEAVEPTFVLYRPLMNQ